MRSFFSQPPGFIEGAFYQDKDKNIWKCEERQGPYVWFSQEKNIATGLIHEPLFWWRSPTAILRNFITGEKITIHAKDWIDHV